MRIRKRKRNEDDSFELFLDTITNTFGGVLLIALLIALLIRQPNKNDTSDNHSSENADVVHSEILALKAEKFALEVSIQTQQNFAKDFQKSESKLLVNQLAPLVKKNAALQRALGWIERNAVKLATKTKKAKFNIAQAEGKIAIQQSEHARLKKLLHDDQKLRTRTTTLPKEKSTSKTEVPIFVAGEQLFFVNANAMGRQFAINTEYFKSSSASTADLNIDSKYYQVRPGLGLPIELLQLKKKLNQYSSTSSFITFVVRSDSFAKFATVKEVCVRSGFEYRVLPTDAMIGESTGASAKTQ